MEVDFGGAMLLVGGGWRVAMVVVVRRKGWCSVRWFEQWLANGEGWPERWWVLVGENWFVEGVADSGWRQLPGRYGLVFTVGREENGCCFGVGCNGSC